MLVLVTALASALLDNVTTVLLVARHPKTQAEMDQADGTGRCRPVWFLMGQDDR